MNEERGMGASEERTFHVSQGEVNLSVERRLTRLEVLLYVLLALSSMSAIGIHLLDSVSLIHP